MDLPEELIEAIERLIAPFSKQKLSIAAKKLRERYRIGLPSLFESPADHLAYLCTRLPATYAAMKRVFQERQFPLGCVVDFGAGLGTSVWALPQAKSLYLIERDSEFKALGQKLRSSSKTTWECADFTQLEKVPPGDLYLFSYSLGEIDPTLYPELLSRFYSEVRSEIVIIEPGTPAGFERIRAIRTLFLAMGAHLIAPCPHQSSCPMEKGDWCHFAQRLSRTPRHRLLKGAELGYEDEKFSYLIVSKKPFKQTQKRILRTPLKRRGHVTFELCTEQGVQKKTITKKEKENYKKCKKLNLGDLID